VFLSVSVSVCVCVCVCILSLPSFSEYSGSGWNCVQGFDRVVGRLAQLVGHNVTIAR